MPLRYPKTCPKCRLNRPDWSLWAADRDAALIVPKMKLLQLACPIGVLFCMKVGKRRLFRFMSVPTAFKNVNTVDLP